MNIPKDKQMHLIAGILYGLLTYLIMFPMGVAQKIVDNGNWNVSTTTGVMMGGLFLCLGLAVGWEVWQVKSGRGKYDFVDAIATTAGCMFVYIFMDVIF